MIKRLGVRTQGLVALLRKSQMVGERDRVLVVRRLPLSGLSVWLGLPSCQLLKS